VNTTAVGAVVGSVVGLVGGYLIGRVLIGDNVAAFRKRKGAYKMPLAEVEDEMAADKVALTGVGLIAGSIIGAAISSNSPSLRPGA
jgi:hypothetical protein